MKKSDPYLRSRILWMRNKYGLEVADFVELFECQNGKCAICQKKLFNIHGDKPDIAGTPPHIDHDHITNKTRGLLCTHCNSGIGFFQDNRGLLLKAIKYLEQYQ
jgi:DNA-directed RNA polymerase subunit RPC12/RpoP